MRLLVYTPITAVTRAPTAGHDKLDERSLVELSFLKNLLHQAQTWLRHDAGRELVLRSTASGLVVEARPLGAHAAVAEAPELESALGAALEEQIGRDYAAALARKHDADGDPDGGAGERDR